MISFNLSVAALRSPDSKICTCVLQQHAKGSYSSTRRVFDF